MGRKKKWSILDHSSNVETKAINDLSRIHAELRSLIGDRPRLVQNDDQNYYGRRAGHRNDVNLLALGTDWRYFLYPKIDAADT